MFEIGIRKSNVTWLSEVYELVGDEFTCLEPYVNNRHKIMARHNVCGKTFMLEPHAFLAGNRCPHCNPARRLTTAEFVTKMRKLPQADDYVLLSEYTGHHSKITVQHIVCGRTYNVTASDFLKGRRCRECGIKGRYKSQSDWEKQVKSLTGSDYIFLEPYVRDDVKIRYRHCCGAEHSVSPNNFINGTRCPFCIESNGEANIRNYLIKHDISFECQKRFDDLRVVHPLSYDFYVPELNALIEFQGEQHYKPIDFFGGTPQFLKQQMYDNLKRDYASNNGLSLIEVSYKQNNFQKVSKFLDSAMSKNKQYS